MSWIKYHRDAYRSEAVRKIMAEALAAHPARPAWNMVALEGRDLDRAEADGELEGAKRVRVLKRLSGYKIELWKVGREKFIVELRGDSKAIVASLDNCRRIAGGSVIW
jgi:hypothetical protein